MNSKPPDKIKFFSSGNIAFVIVVCASYASATTAIIYSRRPVPAWEAAVLVAVGAAYLVVGTYGFAVCRRSRSLLVGVSYFVIQLVLALTLILFARFYWRAGADTASISRAKRFAVALAGDASGLFPDLRVARYAFDNPWQMG
jgi:FlaA1/EpsC-like NDP-sugar epimerase